MLERKSVFPNVIEMNLQAGHLLGSNIYLVYDESEWLLIDIGYDETVDEIIELIRQLDFPLAKCRTIVATHADVDHIQGLSRAKQLLKTTVTAHAFAAKPLEAGDKIQTFAEITAQGVNLDMPAVKIEQKVTEGDSIRVGGLKLEVWHTPGHTDGHLSFRLGDLLFSGDNIFRDGCVGAIDAHHGSNIPDFIRSLTRIRDSNVKWLLPSHGPMFAKDDDLLNATIKRLEGYSRMADFGTCAVEWPLMDQWEDEIAAGKLPSP